MNIDRDKISSVVGQRIHDYRVRKKMSQESLAFAAGLHPAYLGSVERGEKCPSVETIYKISTGLKIPISELLDLDGDTAPTQTEALQRISAAMTGLTDEEAVRVAEVVEKMLSIKEEL
ncbi:MAG: helix-turn-helix domain-containing protein [Oscillospiraceae bacterium]|nr:helix-turn-helix domain-containing protein [Oscillospiraceae bacterium]